VNCYWQDRDPKLRSADGRSAVVLVHVRGVEHAVRHVGKEVRHRFTGTWEGLRVSVSGEAVLLADIEEASAEGMHHAELVAVPLVLVILLWVLGSLPAALLPVAVGVFAVSVTTAFLRRLSESVTVSVFALNITTVLGFALAVDYSLLLVQRYREELATGHAAATALRHTLRTAGRAVACSAVTVALSLCSMLLFPLPLLRSMAYGGVAVVCAAAAGALTLLPACLVLLGKHVDSCDVFARMRRPPAPRVSEGTWFRLAQRVMRRPVAVTLGVLALLLLLAAPVTGVRLGMYDERILPSSAPVAQITQELRADFDPAMVNSLRVVLPRLPAGPRPRAELDAYARRLAQVSGVRQVATETGTYRSGQRTAPPGPDAGSFIGRGRDGSGRWLSVVPERGLDPVSPEGARLARDVRAVPAPGPALVGGRAALLADTEEVLADRLPGAIGITSAATLLVLMLFTRSVLIPLKALMLNVLSLAATAGVLVAVFQQGHFLSLLGDVSATGVTDVIVPSLMFCVAFGLSMDYEVFLLSRIVEEHRQGCPTARAVAVGLQRTGRLFTSAALVFATVTGCLVLSDLLLLKLVGLGLALAVVLDCTVVRAVLVPAVMKLAGDANWWLPSLPARRPRQEPVVSATSTTEAS
jgi:RND superfamily putative drug exporter